MKKHSRTDDALREVEEILFEGIEALPLGFAFYDADNRLGLFNENYRTFLPRSASMLQVGILFEDIIRHSAEIFAAAQGYDTADAYIRARLESPRAAERKWVYKLTTGRWISAYERSTASGGFISVIEDVTESKEAETLLRASETHLKQALRVAKLATWQVRSMGGLILSSEAYELLEVDPAEFDSTQARFAEIIHPEDKEYVEKEFGAALREKCRYHCVYRILSKDGRERIIRASAEPINDKNDPTTWMSGVVQDITETVALETKLQQSQKMEAIGQLTGGIAHDFNNLLSVILGNAELLKINDSDDSMEIAAIERASHRGAELTHRLLAFSRRQPLHPTQIDLCDMVQGMLGLLGRALGETIDIRMIAPKGLWRASADAGQVENALLNLAINARDAMPDGGELIIECSNITLEEESFEQSIEVAGGDYLVLSVTDHGVGMSEQVLNRVFDPFFTTKAVGQGTGLGLSMVYGFARQSGGMATIESEPGIGTIAKLFLPRSRSLNEIRETPKSEKLHKGNGETILVIEDDPAVQILTERMLVKLGYRAICAQDIHTARQAIETYDEIILVLSDIVLPGGTSGIEYAQELHAKYPEKKVVFMSGYPAETAMKSNLRKTNSILLGKPFRITQLAEALRNTLEG